MAALFSGWHKTMIWSCLQGTMGAVYARDTDCPVSAMALLGDFCFLAGLPDRALAVFRPADCRRRFMILVPQHEGWRPLVEAAYGEQIRPVIRYATEKDPACFDPVLLQQVAEDLPSGFMLEQMGEGLYHRCLAEAWSRDLVSNYPQYTAYQAHGLGFIAVKDGVPVAGASSYSHYLGGIEVEIDTKMEYRRRGLARACGARLILACLERGWYPGWDAQNPGSLALARQLGYRFSHAYPAYEVLLSQ